MPGYQRAPEWNAEQDAYDQALREGPTAALNSFSTLFDQRLGASVPLTSDDDELIILGKVLSQYFVESIDTNEELWRASIDSEFVLFLTNVITESSFLDHHPDFGYCICRTLRAILRSWLLEESRPFVVNNAGDKWHWPVPSRLYDAFWGPAKTMWTSLWGRRSTLARRLESWHWRSTFLALETIAFLTDELWSIKCYPQSSCMPSLFQVAYFSWVYLYGDERITDEALAQMHTVQNAPLLLSDYFDKLCADDDKSSTMPQPSHVFMEELVNAIDTQTLVRAAYNTLAYPRSLEDESLSAYLRVLAMQMPLIGLRWYTYLPLAEAVDASLIRSTTRTHDPRLGPGVYAFRSKSAMTAFAAVYSHFRAIIPGLATGIIPPASFPGHVFWDVLVRGMICGCEAANLLRHDRSHCTCGDHEEFAEALSTFLGAISTLVSFLTSEKQEGRLPRSFIDTMREVATKPDLFQVAGLWYAETETLRRFLRCDPLQTTYTILLDDWLKIGDVFSMNEASQRSLETAWRARQCSWRSCVYHSKPSEKPLLVCKGCKDARYCSAACQRSDWKQGGHRTDCRRVKRP